MKIYVAVGHGLTPAGIADPGAVSVPYKEHDLARSVGMAYAAALIRCGFNTYLEPEPDPDYIGSTANANAWKPDLGDEIHFNAGGGSGTEILLNPFTSSVNHNRAVLMAQSVSSALGLRNRGVVSRGDLYWLNATTFPALIPEIAFVDGMPDRSRMAEANFAVTVGEAMARATCSSVALPYIVPGQAPPKPPVYVPPSSPPQSGKASFPPFPGRVMIHTTPMMYGADVSMWQAQMHRRGWTITVDGWYGAQSETIAWRFQGEKHLLQDGKVGKQTWDASWTLPVT
jgi:N-acetylmuramoyl-L-alanine amidase/Putative peptidoglycan binding domain